MTQASNAYLRSAVLTAPPEQLHLMLYDGAIRFARMGIDGIRKKNWENAFNGFSRAQKILLEMINSLNYDVDEDLCKRMASLYSFIYRKLVEASIHRDPRRGDEALGLLEYQRETWIMLIDRLREQQGPAPPDQAAAKRAGPDDPRPLESAYGTVSFEG
jgi:flagellar protein FliS